MVPTLSDSTDATSKIVGEGSAAPASCRLRITEFCVLVAGVFAFSPWRVDWYHHVLIPGGPTLRFAVLPPLALILLAYLGPWIRPATRRNPLQSEDWPLAGRVALGACAIVALIQLLHPLDNIWLLFSWTAAAGLLVARRMNELDGPRLSRTSALAMLILAIALVTWLHIDMQLAAWRELSFGYPDIGHFARALLSTVQGRGVYVDSYGHSLFGDHSFFALLALAPICRLGVDPFLLLVTLSPLLMSGSSLIIYWYSLRSGTGTRLSLLSAFAWLLLPMHGCVVYSMGYGFHEAQMAVPLIAAGIAFTELGMFRRATLMMCLALLVREDVSLTVAGWAAYMFLFKRRRVEGATMLVVAIAYLVTMVWVVIPWFRGAAYPHLNFHFTASESDPLRTGLYNLSFIATLSIPVAGLCFNNWRLLLTAVPAVGEAMLSRNPDVHNIVFHYYIPAIPGIFFAALIACRRPVAGEMCSQPEADRSSTDTHGVDAIRYSRPLVILLLVAAFLGQVYWGTGDWTHHRPGRYSDPRLAASYPQIRTIHDMVLPGRSVSASYRIAAQFIDADQLWMTSSGVLADAIVLDDTDVMIGHNPRELLSRACRTGEYEPIHADYHLVAVMKNAGVQSIAPSLIADSNPLAGSIEPFDMGSGIQLVGFRCTSDSTSPVVRMSIVWRLNGHCSEDLRFGVTDGDRRWGPFYFARGAYPTNAWRPELYYRDELILERSADEQWNCSDLSIVLLQ